MFVQHGAPKEILIDSHPHIGSNKLPRIIESIRNTVITNGGEIYFDSRVTELIVKDKKILGAATSNGKEFLGDSVLLAAGHSARDIYYLLDKNHIKLEAKSFAMGVRIEHPQIVIDSIQYHSKTRHSNLPPASYTIACQIEDRGVYSFCMCPGGIIIPASTEPGEIVLNGMSVSRRNSPFANSGLVVTVNENDWMDYYEHGVFAGLMFQRQLEQSAFKASGNSIQAPAQKVTDFVKGKISSSLNNTSYIPGIVSSPLHEILPPKIVKSLQKSLGYFGKKMRGYYTEEAQILAAETRTSSPIRIPRDPKSLMHVEIEGLFPAGEGAGYAGGIVSSAIDGERCAEAAVKWI